MVPDPAPPTSSGHRAEPARSAPVPHGTDGPVHDVLVVGGGPSGSSCAYWLADAGWDVALVEKKTFPREKTCGDGLTPRSVRQLQDMGLENALAGAHRYDGLRSCAYGRERARWPSVPGLPGHGYIITRHDLDGLVAERAAKAGATVLQGTEVLEPILADRSERDGATDGLAPCIGARVRRGGAVQEIRARYVVVADGSNSRFGRALGATRDRRYPLGLALRGYYRSPRHDDTFIESHLDLRDPDGAVVPGYGWIFPLGDGRVNVGVGLLSAEGRWKGLNTTQLLDRFIATAPASWGLSPESACGPATGGKLPMGLAVGPRLGPTTLTVGDTGGSINPFNGEGIAYGYETGRLAAATLGEALAGGGGEALTQYEQRLQERYGLYYRVAREFVGFISDPRRMKASVWSGMRVPMVMKTLLPIMANLLQPDGRGVPESTYRALAAIALRLPSR